MALQRLLMLSLLGMGSSLETGVRQGMRRMSHTQQRQFHVNTMVTEHNDSSFTASTHTPRAIDKQRLETGPVISARNAQATPFDPAFVYRVNYTARYQLIQDTTCDGPSPVIRVYCRHGNLASLAVHATSDPSIVCRSAQIDSVTGWVFVECINTCSNSSSTNATTDSCRSVYLQVDGSIDVGPFGHVDFTCRGNTTAELEAAATFVDSGNGTCGTAASGLTRNLHILRLGVSCPASDNATTLTMNDTATTVVPLGRSMVFDDAYFECTPSTSSYPYGDNLYTCLVGASCNGIPCVVDFDPLLVWTNAMAFASCVESIVAPDEALLSTVPTLSPTSLVPSSFTAQFVASWGLLLDPLSVAACNGSVPTIQVECVSSEIQWNQPAESSLNCTLDSPSVMTCINRNRDSFVDQFTSVQYTCTGPVVPQTQVGFVENVAYCDGNSVEGIVTHALQLGITCGMGTAQQFLFSGDLFLDCVAASPQFGYLDPLASPVISNASRYTCSESVVFAAGSLRNQTRTIPYLAMSTDVTWAATPDGTCYQVTPLSVETASPTVLPFVPSSPVSMPKPTLNVVPWTTTAPLPPSPMILSPIESSTQPQPVPGNVTTTVASTDTFFGVSIVIVAGVASGAGTLLVSLVVIWLVRRRTHRATHSAVALHGSKPTVALTLRDAHDTSWTESHTDRRLSDIWVTDSTILERRMHPPDHPRHNLSPMEAEALFQVIRLSI